MGWFKKALGIATLGLVGDSPFKGLRTGATRAAKDAKAAGELQLGEQAALREELKGMYAPQMEAGQQAFQGLADFYGGNQQPMIDQTMASPFYQSNIDVGEQAIARNKQATGGFRSGTMQENLAQNSQNVLQGMVQQNLQGQQNIYNAGAGAQDAYAVAMQNILAGQGATRGEIANIGINQAASKQNMYTGLAGLASNFIPMPTPGGTPKGL